MVSCILLMVSCLSDFDGLNEVAFTAFINNNARVRVILQERVKNYLS